MSDNSRPSHRTASSPPRRKAVSRFKATEITPQNDPIPKPPQNIIQESTPPVIDEPTPTIALNQITVNSRHDDDTELKVDSSLLFRALEVTPSQSPHHKEDHQTKPDEPIICPRAARLQRARENLAKTIALENTQDSLPDKKPHAQSPLETTSASLESSTLDPPQDEGGAVRVTDDDDNDDGDASDEDSTDESDELIFIPKHKRIHVKSTEEEEMERQAQEALEAEAEERRAMENTAAVRLEAELLELEIKHNQEEGLPDDTDDLEMEMVDIAQWRVRECRRLLAECRQRLIYLGEIPMSTHDHSD